MSRRREWMLVVFVVGVCVLSVPARVLAQGLGRISGTVTDQSGAAIPNATVTATQKGTGEITTVQSDSAGVYVFPSLAPAQYSIAGKAKGFSTYVESNAVLEADQALTVNVPLKIGNAAETITVSDAPPQVDTTTGTMSEVIGTAQTNELPLNGRNAASLTALVAGVTYAPAAQADQGNTKTFPVAFTISANGTLVGQTNYLLDGGNNVDEYTNVNAPFPMPDALQEFSVQTSNYSAEYGQNAGGVVNIVTKSGTNRFHGDLFEFIRNRAFNAANYFSYTNGVKIVDPLKRNQFGGTIGGPISIPHLYNGHDKSFFFFGYQKTINHGLAPAGSATLPTAAQLAGTFAGEKACLSDPLQPSAIISCTPTGATFTTVVNPTAYSSAAIKLLSYLPPTSALNANGGFSYSLPNNYDLGEVTARVDQVLGPKDRLMLRYFSDVYSLQGFLNLADLLTYTDFAKNNYYNSAISETHTFSARILNNFILSYQIENDSRGPEPGSIDAADLGVNIWQPAYKQINSIAASGDFNIGGNPQAFFRRANYTLIDDLHIQLGSHSIAFGYHGEVAKIDVNNLYRQPGNFTFNGNNTGDAMASFLFGYVEEFSQASGQFFNARDVFTGFYAEDSWKANRKLVVNYGVRWEPFKPWRESQGRMGSFFPNLWAQGVHSVKYPNAPAGLLFAGDQGFNPNGVADEFGHFMPRLGFAYDVFGTGKTSVRGGFGTFYDSRINSTLFNIYTNSSPFITNVDVTNATPGTKITFADPYGSYGTPNPFPAAQPPPSTAAIPPQGFLTFDPFHGFQDPITYNWNLAAEQQVTGGLSARLAYVGEHSSHNWVPLELNPFVNGTRVYNQPGCATNNSCYTSTLTATNTGANMSYNSLQFSATQRLRYGLTVLANYTWSKALNDAPFNAAATSIAAGNSYVYPITVTNFKKLDYGPADFDHRNVASLSYVYVEPQVMKDASRGLRYLVNGWETTGLFVFRSGDPLTIISSSSNVSGSGQTRDRAIEIGPAYGGSACAAGTHCKSYLNPASFTLPTAGNYGTFVKGSLVGPQYADWDVSAGRSFPFNESTSLVFRAEYFNVLNHTNFGDPNSTAGASNFGQITSTTSQNANLPNDPRIAQFSLKLVF